MVLKQHAPDLPVKDIEVRMIGKPPTQTKQILWHYPYERLSGDAGFFDCNRFWGKARSSTRVIFSDDT
jgi:hypothetical protein